MSCISLLSPFKERALGGPIRFRLFVDRFRHPAKAAGVISGAHILCSLPPHSSAVGSPSGDAEKKPPRDYQYAQIR